MGHMLEALREGYKPLALAHEDADLVALAEQTEKPKPTAKPLADLAPHPREASPFSLAESGEIQPQKERPPPPAGFEVLHFGPR